MDIKRVSRWKIIVLCILIVGLILIRNMKCEKVLVVEDVDEHVKNEFILLDPKFTIGYTHSVLLTPVEEFFQVKDSHKLFLYETIYESFGVGLPYSQEEGDFQIKDGKFILKIQRNFDAIHLRVSPIPKHWLSVGDHRYELIDLVKKPDDLIKIYVVDRWVLKIGKDYKTF
ncbi:DUF1850 domain-containing protein [Inediibacterium massiliense]|uniref:DUF1850 domain-containing protein n=1 Tax=Inediibacterium massiliense TaxID=1658111 RepID=UPI0006B681E8|nr:DUF1850 domain-containing protein [Inediibacterium massiliense]